MDTQVRSTWRSSPPVMARGECTLCQGTGWQLVSVYGSSRARRCSCGALLRVLRLRQDVKIPLQYHHCSLDAYQPENLSQAQALAEAQRFAERFPKVERGICFVGGEGAGKTHLAVGIVLKLLQRFQEDILFIDSRSLACSSESNLREEQISDCGLTRAEHCSLLVLDNFDFTYRAGHRLDSAQKTLSTRLQSGRITLLTARGLTDKYSGPKTNVPAANLVSGRFPSGSPIASMRLLSGFRILRLHTEGGRRNGSGLYPLFGTACTENRTLPTEAWDSGRFRACRKSPEFPEEAQPFK